METFVLFAMCISFYYYGKFEGKREGYKAQQDKDEHIMHTSLCERNSPSIRVTWRCIAGETTVQEMREELSALNPIYDEEER